VYIKVGIIHICAYELKELSSVMEINILFEA